MNEMNRKAMLLCSWFGPVSILICIIGGCIIGGYMPPLLSPSMTGEQMITLLVENQTSVQIG